MKVGSLFAGIGGFDLGFQRAGFEVAWCVEWDKKAQAVLAKRFPEAKIYGDIREVDASQLAPVDVVCGGFPCQDLSVAGLRGGLSGERSGLFHEGMRIVRAIRPRVVILENVFGLLTSNHGRDFAAVVREVGEGWPCAEVGWRVLDSRYFGVPQRRRRVFVVGGSRTGCAEQILSLSDSREGSPRQMRDQRDGCSSDASRRARIGNGATGIIGPAFAIDAQNMTAGHASGGKGFAHDGEPLFTLSRSHHHAVAFSLSAGATWTDFGYIVEATPPLRAGPSGNCMPAVHCKHGSDEGRGCIRETVVRRIMPVEAERLQGFPDGWTQIGSPEKPTSDTTRYKQLGNAVTVNVAHWLARRTLAALT